MGNVKIILLVIALLGAAGASAWGVWEYRGQKIEVLEAKNAQQELVIANRDQFIAEREKSITDLQENVALLQAESMQYFRLAAKNRSERDAAYEKLEKHDRDFLALNKPGLVAPILDRESRHIERCLELANNPDAVLTDAEIDATRPSEINPFCWADANPNFDPDLQSKEWQVKNR